MAQAFLLSTLRPLTALISTKTGPDRQKFTIQTHEIFKACCQREAIPDMFPPKASSLCPWHTAEAATLALDEWFVFDVRQKGAATTRPITFTTTTIPTTHTTDVITQPAITQKYKNMEKTPRASGFFSLIVINKDEPRHQLPAPAERNISEVPVTSQKPKKGLKYCGQSSVPRSVRTSLLSLFSSSGRQKSGPQTGPKDGLSRPSAALEVRYSTSTLREAAQSVPALLNRPK